MPHWHQQLQLCMSIEHTAQRKVIPVAAERCHVVVTSLLQHMLDVRLAHTMCSTYSIATPASPPKRSCSHLPPHAAASTDSQPESKLHVNSADLQELSWAAMRQLCVPSWLRSTLMANRPPSDHTSQCYVRRRRMLMLHTSRGLNSQKQPPWLQKITYRPDAYALYVRFRASIYVGHAL
jgi:hypothetical protein